jgi:hypothetical protein
MTVFCTKVGLQCGLDAMLLTMREVKEMAASSCYCREYREI